MDKTVRQLGRATQVQSGQTAGRASSAPISKTPKPLLQNFKNSQDLEAHFNKHRSEWGDISAYQYLSKARALLKQDADKNILQKIRVHNGDMVKYDLKNNQMVIARNDGSIRTFFRPKNGIEYWNQLK
jgi:pyocin large subunit-like protein